jgi:hypothetical protein
MRFVYHPLCFLIFPPPLPPFLRLQLAPQAGGCALPGTDTIDSVLLFLFFLGVQQTPSLRESSNVPNLSGGKGKECICAVPSYLMMLTVIVL